MERLTKSERFFLLLGKGVALYVPLTILLAVIVNQVGWHSLEDAPIYGAVYAWTLLNLCGFWYVAAKGLARPGKGFPIFVFVVVGCIFLSTKQFFPLAFACFAAAGPVLFVSFLAGMQDIS